MSAINDNSTVDYVFKSLITDKEKRIISGIATVEEVDEAKDIIVRDSVKAVFDDYMENPVVLMYHDTKRPVAKVTQHKDDISKSNNPAIRIWVQHGFSKDPTSDIERSWELVEQGILNAFSVRIKPSHVQKNGHGGNRVYAEVLREISYVTLPGNKETLIDTIVKSLDQGVEPIGEVNTMTPEEMKAILADFGNTLKSEIKEDVTKQLDARLPTPEPEVPLTFETALKNADFKKDLDTFVEDKIANSSQLAVLTKALNGTNPQGDGTDKGKKKSDNPTNPGTYGTEQLNDYLKTLS